MRERDKECKLLLLPRNTVTKEKRTKKKDKGKQSNLSKKRGHSSTPQNSDDTDKPQPRASLAHEATTTTTQKPAPPEESRDQLVRVKGRVKHGEGVIRRTRIPKEVTGAITSRMEKNTSGAAPSQGGGVEISAQARESLRWEGVLEDPLAEEKRLEVYKANRRQRYLLQRQAQITEAKTPVCKPEAEQH